MDTPIEEKIYSLLTEAGIVTTQDVVRILGFSAPRVRAAAKDLMSAGRIGGHKTGGGWVYWHSIAVDEKGNVRPEWK